MTILRRAALLLALILLCCGESRAFNHISFEADGDSLAKRYPLCTSVEEKAMILERCLIIGNSLDPYSYDSTLAIYHALPGNRDPEASGMVKMMADVHRLIIQKRFEEALVKEEQIIAAFEAQHDTDGIFATLRTPGQILFAANRFDEAVRYYKRKADYYRQHGPQLNLAHCYNFLANIYYFKGNTNQSISYFLRSSEAFKTCDHKMYTNDQLCAAQGYADWGNAARARYYFGRLMSDESDSFSMLYSYRRLAQMDLEEGNAAAALRRLDSAEGFFKMAPPVLPLQVAETRAEVFLQQHRTDEAGAILKDLIRRADSLKCGIFSSLGTFELDYLAYLYHRQRGAPDAATASLDTALAKALRVNYYVLKLKYWRELAFWQRDKSPALAIRYASDFINLSDSLAAVAGPNNIANYESEMQEAAANKSINALKEEQQAQAIQLQSRKKVLGRTYLALGLFAALALSLFYFNRRATKATRIIRTEKARSEALLLNILPAEVAEELKNSGASAARQYEEVSVLFTDFVDFTGVSETLGPQALVQELNECFTAFDAIIERNGLEKIKTIGDAYLAVCGLPVSDERHAQRTLQAAIEIRDFIAQRSNTRRDAVPASAQQTFQIRIGINSGPVVAGIVGVKKFAYDIWGDTVNTAARMEQHSEPGKINISESTYALVKDEYRCEARGKIAAKNKGEVEMYFVEAQ